ncbi:MAG: hypothetical protein QW568_00580 [Candidatus Anstonellaceae archaeon]
MASFKSVSLLLVFLAHSLFAAEVTFNVSGVRALVEYQYDINVSQAIVGVRYPGTIHAVWAIPQSALSGLEGKTVTVKITGRAENSSSVFFLSPINTDAYETEVYLYCTVEKATCSNESVLTADIPITILLPSNGTFEQKITLKDEIVDSSLGALPSSAGSILDSFSELFSGNQSAPNGTGASNSSEDFLESLKPEGNSKDPIAFLRQNQLVSLTALAIVVVITGAYLLNSRD